MALDDPAAGLLGHLVADWARGGKALVRGLQARQDDGHQPLDRGLGGQPASCRDGVQAVAGQLLRRDIIADLTAGCALAQQVPDEVPELLVGLGDMGASM